MPANTLSPDIPIFKLYGEAQAWPTPDLLHCESISERSHSYNWKIKPHRHNDLLQLLLLESGEGLATLDGRELSMQPPCVLLISPMCIHSFEFSDKADGFVLSLAAPLLQQLKNNLGEQQSILNEAHYYSVNTDQLLFKTLFDAINREYSNYNSGREILLESMINALMILLSRQASNTTMADSSTNNPAIQNHSITDKGSQHFSTFTQLLEQHFRSHCSVENYASLLGITPAHLNTICQRFASRSALQLAHERLLLEAKRNLIYTAMTISQVSDSLGFSEPAYFTRFFKRLTTRSPKKFRQNHLTTKV